MRLAWFRLQAGLYNDSRFRSYWIAEEPRKHFSGKRCSLLCEMSRDTRVREFANGTRTRDGKKEEGGRETGGDWKREGRLRGGYGYSISGISGGRWTLRRLSRLLSHQVVPSPVLEYRHSRYTAWMDYSIRVWTSPGRPSANVAADRECSGTRKRGFPSSDRWWSRGNGLLFINGGRNRARSKLMQTREQWHDSKARKENRKNLFYKVTSSSLKSILSFTL